MKKFNISTKVSNAWNTFMYATTFEDGKTSIQVKPEKLEALLNAINSGALQVDKYGYIKFAMFEQTEFKKNNAPVLKSDSMPF